MTGDDEERARLRQELDLQRDLVRWIRDALYGIEPAGSRDLAATAEAAAAAQECYRIADGERDRPQTIAAHYAVVGVVFGFVDAALLAVDQVFECLDLRYDGELPDERRAAGDRTWSGCAAGSTRSGTASRATTRHCRPASSPRSARPRAPDEPAEPGRLCRSRRKGSRRRIEWGLASPTRVSVEPSGFDGGPRT